LCLLCLVLQASICTELIKRLLQYGPALTAASAAVAELDCLCSLAAAARELGYCRPQLVADSVINIQGGMCIARRDPKPLCVVCLNHAQRATAGHSWWQTASYTSREVCTTLNTQSVLAALCLAHAELNLMLVSGDMTGEGGGILKC
jgi:hypothetical protein